MSPDHVHAALVTWRAAERARNGYDQDTPEYEEAETAVVGAREAYLAAVRELAERRGSSAMQDVPAVPEGD